jgi:hypothetical protein
MAGVSLSGRQIFPREAVCLVHHTFNTLLLEPETKRLIIGIKSGKFGKHL